MKAGYQGAFGHIAFLFVCVLTFAIAVSRGASPSPETRFDPELVASFKSLPLEKLFADYKHGYEGSSRTEAARLHEILSRFDVLDFLSARLKKNRSEPDTHEKIEAREKSAYLLGKMGPLARPAVPLLIDCLEDEENVRHRVTSALADLGPVAVEAKPALLEELHFQNGEAARALFKIDPTSDETLNAVIEAASDSSNEPNFRSQTIGAFYEYKSNPARARAFLESVAKQNNWIAEGAKRQLEMLDWRTTRHTAPLLPRGLAQPPPPSAETNATALLDKLKSNPDDYPTAQALTNFTSEVRRQAVGILIDAIKQNKVRFPSNLISRIAFFGPDAKEALPLMLEFADSDQSGFANNAMFAIGEIGPAAITAKPAVERGLDDTSGMLRWRAANTLCLIDPDHLDEHLEHLVQVLKGSNGGEYTDYAVRSLGKFGPRAKAAAPFLIEKLGDENLRVSAAEALSKIATDHETKSKIASALVKDLKHEFVYTRDSAARILGDLGPDARAALPALKEAAKSDDSEFAKISKDSIQKIEAAKE